MTAPEADGFDSPDGRTYSGPVTAQTPGQPPAGIEVTHDPEVPVRLVRLWLCDPCIDGQGHECHTPGCALFLNRPPDIPIRDSPLVTILDAAPDGTREPQTAPGVAEQLSRYWTALFYIAHRQPEYVPYAGPECVDVARKAIGDDPSPAPGDEVASLRAKLDAVSRLTAGMHAEADASESGHVSAALHGWAARIRQALGPDVTREALDAAALRQAVAGLAGSLEAEATAVRPGSGARLAEQVAGRLRDILEGK